MASTPPEWQIGRPRQTPRTLWGDLAELWHRFRGLPFLPQLIIGLLVTIIAVAVISIPFRSSPTTTVTIRTSTTQRAAATSSTSTSTTKPLPPGDDKAVKAIIDGDSFETSDGVKVRLLGVDAPDIETSDCFSSEATTHLQSLIGPPRSVRLVYDTSRTDRLGRTLAYVYRLPDGLLINLAMAEDGFMFELKVEPNTSHAAEFAAAVSDARTAKRGLWSTCDTTTTTAAPRATTTTARATTTSPATTTTTAAATTTTTTAPTATTSATSTTTAPQVVVENAPCSPPGSTGVFADGRPAVCVGLLSGTWRPVS